MKIPKEFRIGQSVFNFLAWLKEEKKMENTESHRMADPYFISDEDWEILYNEFIESL